MVLLRAGGRSLVRWAGRRRLGASGERSGGWMMGGWAKGSGEGKEAKKNWVCWGRHCGAEGDEEGESVERWSVHCASGKSGGAPARGGNSALGIATYRTL